MGIITKNQAASVQGLQADEFIFFAKKSCEERGGVAVAPECPVGILQQLSTH